MDWPELRRDEVAFFFFREKKEGREVGDDVTARGNTVEIATTTATVQRQH